MCERREGTCWILGIKQLLRDADGGGASLRPSVYHRDVLILNDERCLVLFFLEPRSQGQNSPLGYFERKEGEQRPG